MPSARHKMAESPKFTPLETSPAAPPSARPARKSPVPYDGFSRDVEHSRGLLHAQTHEKPQLPDACLARIRLGQPIESVIQRDELLAAIDPHLRDVIQVYARCIASSFRRLPLPRGIEQDLAACEFSRRRQKNAPDAAIIDVLDFNQPEKTRLVDKARWPVWSRRGSHSFMNRPATRRQFLVNPGSQLLERQRLIAFGPGAKEGVLFPETSCRPMDLLEPVIFTRPAKVAWSRFPTSHHTVLPLRFALVGMETILTGGRT